MSQQEFINLLKDYLNQVSLSQKNKIIEIIGLEIPEDDYEKIICAIDNLKGTLKMNQSWFEQQKNDLANLYQQVQNEDIYFYCYAVPNGTYSYYDENEDIFYIATSDMNRFLCLGYEFAKKLIYYKEYVEALKILDLILFTSYTCNEIGNPEYDNSDSIYNTFNVNISDVRDELPFNLDDVCLYAIYAALLSEVNNKLEKVYKYLKLCRVYRLHDAYNLGIEPVKNIDAFYDSFINYLSDINDDYIRPYIIKLKENNKKDEN